MSLKYFDFCEAIAMHLINQDDPVNDNRVSAEYNSPLITKLIKLDHSTM